jgi:ammonia channel protein AmtB
MVRAIVSTLPIAVAGLAILTAFAELVQPSSALLYAAGATIAGFTAIAVGRYDEHRARQRR